MLRLIEQFTDPDELVVDPFCGAGTTGVACLRLGRRFIGCDIDEKYATVSRRRLEAEESGMRLTEVEAGQVALFPGEK
jgi:site-specific DNA-methyltransferase (adenine-specific)